MKSIALFLIGQLFVIYTITTVSSNSDEKDLVQPSEMHYDGVPKFIKQPKPLYYVNSTHSVWIECEAEPVAHANIICADKQNPYKNVPEAKEGLYVEMFKSSTKQNLDDKSGSQDDSSLSQSGYQAPHQNELKRWKFKLEITLKYYNQWFTPSFKCYCEAWNNLMEISKAKKVRSTTGLIKESFMKEKFRKHPISENAVIGNVVSLLCQGPEATPKATITWLKNGKALRDNGHIRIKSSDNSSSSLIIQNFKLSDKGNYTCKATSLSVERYSKPAAIGVSDVDARDKFYDSWSISCKPYCQQTRWRVCTNDNGPCSSKEKQVRNCTEDLCSISKQSEPNSDGLQSEKTVLYLSLFITIAILFIIILFILCLLTRRGYIQLLSKRNFSNHSNGVKNPYSDKLISNMNNEKLLSTNHHSTSGNNNQYYSFNSQLLTNNTLATPSDHIENCSKHPPITIKNHSASLQHTNNHFYTQTTPSHQLISNNNSILTNDTKNNNSNSNNDNNDSNNNSNDNYSPVYEIHSAYGNGKITPAIYAEYTTNFPKSSPFHHSPNSPLITNETSPARSKPDITQNNNNIDISTPAQQSSSALYQELSLGRNVVFNPATNANKTKNNTGMLGNFLPLDTDLDTVAWGNFTGVGGRLCLPQSGIYLTIPQGTLSIGRISEEIFLSVCRDMISQPIIDAKEILLTPVVLCGPPNLSMNRSMVVSIPHCASIDLNGNNYSNWNIRVLSASYRNNQIPPLWKELATIQPLNRSDSHTYCQLDTNMIHLILDAPQMICLTGKPSCLDQPVTVILRVLIFNCCTTRHYQRIIKVHFVLNTKEAVNNIIDKELETEGSVLLDNCKVEFTYGNGDLVLNVTDLSYSWKCINGNLVQNFSKSSLWQLNHIKSLETTYVFESFDPTSNQPITNPLPVNSTFTCSFYTHQIDSLNHMAHMSRDIAVNNNSAKLHIVIDNWTQQHHQNIQKQQINNGNTPKILMSHHKQNCFHGNEVGRILNDEFQQQLFIDQIQTVFRLSFEARQNLWPLLDPSWQTLANHMSLNGNLNYFSEKSSPSDAILDLWEARNREETAVFDLINIMRLIGRNDCAIVIEQDLMK